MQEELGYMVEEPSYMVENPGYIGEDTIYWERTLVMAKEPGGMVVIWFTIMVDQLLLKLAADAEDASAAVSSDRFVLIACLAFSRHSKTFIFFREKFHPYLLPVVI